MKNTPNAKAEFISIKENTVCEGFGKDKACTKK